jgi:hypothetical protein
MRRSMKTFEAVNPDCYSPQAMKIDMGRKALANSLLGCLSKRKAFFLTAQLKCPYGRGKDINASEAATEVVRDGFDGGRITLLFLWRIRFDRKNSTHNEIVFRGDQRERIQLQFHFLIGLARSFFQ